MMQKTGCTYCPGAHMQVPCRPPGSTWRWLNLSGAQLHVNLPAEALNAHRDGLCSICSVGLSCEPCEGARRDA